MKTGTDKPHWQGHRERLRGKLLSRGAAALDDYEILEVLLMAFIPRRDVKPIAKAPPPPPISSRSTASARPWPPI